MNNNIKHALEDHAEVLRQYLDNDSTDQTALAFLIKRLMVKLFKKQYIEYVLNYINIGNLTEFHTKLADKLGNDLADEIIAATKKQIAKKK
jgi:hypothetical protein